MFETLVTHNGDLYIENFDLQTRMRGWYAIGYAAKARQGKIPPEIRTPQWPEVSLVEPMVLSTAEVRLAMLGIHESIRELNRVPDGGHNVHFDSKAVSERVDTLLDCASALLEFCVVAPESLA